MSKQTETIQAPGSNGSVTPSEPPASKPEKPVKTAAERLSDAELSGMEASARKLGQVAYFEARPQATTRIAAHGLAKEKAEIEARLADPRYLEIKRALKSALAAK